jgi:hypothetical protein
MPKIKRPDVFQDHVLNNMKRKALNGRCTTGIA